MSTVLKFGKVQWIHISNPNDDDIKKLINTYDLHELIEEDLLENTSHEKIDIYEDHMYIVLNFPKYQAVMKKYLLNEFSIILGKNLIITLTRYETNHIDTIIQEYEQELKERDKDEEFKISPYYILYRIIDTMYEKTLKMLNVSAKEVMHMEEQLFASNKLEKTLLESLTIKKRNIVSLKHIFIPHQEIIDELQQEIPKFYKEDLDVYFEDLTAIVDRIMNTIAKSYENVESLSDTYNSLMNIKTNSVINVLTIFSAITGVLTLISGIYGMNIPLPGQTTSFFFFLLMGGMLIITIVLLLIFKKKKWI